MNEISFAVDKIASKILAGLIRSAPSVITGTLAGSRIVQPQRTLILSQHKFVDQASGTAVVVIPSLMEKIGITDKLELRKYLLRCWIWMVMGGDLGTTDDVSLHLVSGSAEIRVQVTDVGKSSSKIPYYDFHLDADVLHLDADAFDWAAAETHSYTVYYEIYRLTDDIGQFSL